jgi:uncharacterized protein
MVPEYPSLESLRNEHRDILVEHLALKVRTTCDLALANLYLWSECEEPSLTIIHGNLCILIDPHSEPAYFLEPLGRENLIETVEICLKQTGRISRVSESFLEVLPPGQFQASPLRDHFDYIYEVRDLAELKGKKYDGKRNQIKKFHRNFPNYGFLPLRKGHLPQALDLFDRWASGRDSGSESGDAEAPANVVCQRHAIQKAFTDFDELGLMGGAIFVNNYMEGFMIASSGGHDTATAHLQYANSNMAGIYQVLLSETCRQILPAFAMINLEEDLGIPGLRKTKLSNQPVRLEKKFLITPANGSQ